MQAAHRFDRGFRSRRDEGSLMKIKSASRLSPNSLTGLNQSHAKIGI